MPCYSIILVSEFLVPLAVRFSVLFDSQSHTILWDVCTAGMLGYDVVLMEYCHVLFIHPKIGFS